MQSRRDRVMAYNFTVGRLGTAMLEGDPDAADAPMRRTRGGTYIGLGIGALICVGFLVFGFIMPGGATSWQQEGRIVVDRDGGATYLYSEGVLRPVGNLASARLIVGDGAQTSLVRQASLEGFPVGGPVGIPGAPDALPKANATTVWRFCALPPAAGQEAPSGRTVLVAGDAPPPRVPRTDQGILVSDPDGTVHLLWNGSRLRMEEDSGAVQALGYGSRPVLAVSSAFLETIPEGPGLETPPVTGAGDPGPDSVGNGHRVGQVFAVSAPGQEDQHHLLTREGLVPLTQTEALLLLADPNVSGPAYGGASPEALALSAAETHGALAPGPSAPRNPTGLPSTPPTALDLGSAAPCVRWDEDGTPLLTVDDPGEIQAWPVHDRPFIEPGCPTPDLVGIPSGLGGAVRALPVGGAETSPTFFVVTDAAAKYPVADDDALGALGYTPASAAPLPMSILRVLPTGPLLSQEVASLPLASSPRSGGQACP